MRHVIYFPAYVPAPRNGAWIYVIAYAWEQGFHSVGMVERTGKGDFNNETYVCYKSNHLPQFANRPL